MQDPRRIVVSGRAVPVRGHDIDTDRIVPARFLKTVVFDGLGEHAFEDDRVQLRRAGKVHPFDDPRFSGAKLLLVNRNFGCGSSREHAPQAILRWGAGIAAIVGESFAEIFFGNCVANGIPCATLGPGDVETLMAAVERDPGLELRVDLESMTIGAATQRFRLSLPEGARRQFLDGRWDSTTELLAAKDEIETTASKLPYFTSFS